MRGFSGDMIGGLAPMALNAGFALVGDSYLSDGYGNNTDANQIFVNIGLNNSLMEYIGNPWRMNFKGNLAVSGTIMSQIALTVAPMLATFAASGLVILEGGPNDIAAFTSAATINAVWDSVIAAVLADPKGHRVLVHTVHVLQTPYGDSRDQVRLDVNTPRLSGTYITKTPLVKCSAAGAPAINATVILIALPNAGVLTPVSAIIDIDYATTRKAS